MSKLVKCVAALALMAASIAPASANLVTNGGFEQGTTSWSVNGWSMGNFQRGSHSGANSAGTGCTDGQFNCTFGQTLSTAAGQRYDLSFWLYADGYTDESGNLTGYQFNGLRVRFGGTDVFTAIDFPTTNTNGSYVPGGPSTRITVNNILANSPLTFLQFAGYHGPAGIFVDDISVEASAAVPEPGTLALAGLALAGLAASRRRKSRAAK